MSIFPNNKSSIIQIWKTTNKLYRSAIIHVWYLGVMIALANTVSTLASITYKISSTNSNVIGFILPLTISLTIVYLTSIMLLKLYEVGTKQKISFNYILTYVNKRYFKVVIGMLIVFILSNIFSMCSFFVPQRFIMPLIIIQIFVIMLLVIVQPLILFDDLGIIASLRKSCKLIWGNWWYTFAIMFPLIFINYWIGYLIEIAVLNKAWHLIGISALLGTLFSFWFYGCILTIFNDLKLRNNEGITTIPFDSKAAIARS